MKQFISVLLIATLMSFFAQCKKGVSPTPVTDADSLTYGNYIIRTKYLCNGKAFILGAASNHEILIWQEATGEDIKGIANDKPFTNNNFVWTLGKSYSTYPSVILEAFPGYTPDKGVSVFSLSQTGPDGTVWYLMSPPKESNPQDNTGLGLGPSYRAAFSGFTAEPSGLDAAFSYHWATDSTGRITDYVEPHWWNLSLPTDPDEVCNSFNSSVIWRTSFICPNSTVIGGTPWWRFDDCAISQVVFEKVK